MNMHIAFKNPNIVAQKPPTKVKSPQYIDQQRRSIAKGNQNHQPKIKKEHEPSIHRPIFSSDSWTGLNDDQDGIRYVLVNSACRNLLRLPWLVIYIITKKNIQKMSTP